MVIYDKPSFKMIILTFVLSALREEACRSENGSSFHTLGSEYVKVFLKRSVFAFGICNFSLATFRREYGFLSYKYCKFFFEYTGASFLDILKQEDIYDI
jgi:hypothetical protein